MIIDLEHPDGQKTKGPGNPLKFSRTSEEAFTAAPVLGQDTDDVFADILKCSPEQIAELRSKGVIG